MKENNKVSAASHLLVGSGKSSRLSAMRNKAQQPKNRVELDGNKTRQPIIAGLNQQQTVALQKTSITIDERMTQMMSSYPAGKKKTFFKLKFGVNAEKIKVMAIKDIFILLNLDSAKIQHFRLIENLDLNGKTVESDEA
ncbi:MAG: hypothetical protein L3J75_03990 [Methylococcaceae bacterium]|nr:hypothetical protein [Methylococcaceae bacterium]